MFFVTCLVVVAVVAVVDVAAVAVMIVVRVVSLAVDAAGSSSYQTSWRGDYFPH